MVEQSRHLVFAGNPGTGKTTVARLLAQIYRTLGVVEKGHLVETDRSDLVAGFVGQTATKVVAVFDRADQGVLLVDEAYALVRGGGNDFGREAIDTVVKLVEDRRDRLVVIMAGYPEEMDELVAANPGLRSRFPKTIVFDDYSTDDLLAIFASMGEKNGYACDDEATEKLRAWFDAQPRDHGFGNGRAARNLFEAAVARHASRVVDVEEPSDEALSTLVAADIPDLDEPADSPIRRPPPSSPTPRPPTCTSSARCGAASAQSSLRPPTSTDPCLWGDVRTSPGSEVRPGRGEGEGVEHYRRWPCLPGWRAWSPSSQPSPWWAGPSSCGACSRATTRTTAAAGGGGGGGAPRRPATG